MSKEVLSPARTYLVENNLGLVHHVLHRNMHIHTDYYLYEDCYQEGCLGLTYAAIRFDPTLGFEFTTYACMLMRGQILRFLRDFNNEHKYSRTAVSFAHKVVAYSKEHNVTLAEAMKELKVPFRMQSQVVEYLTNKEHSSFDEVVYENKDGHELTLGSMLADPDSTNFILQLTEEEQFRYIESIIPEITSKFTSETARFVYIDYITELMYESDYSYNYTQMELAKKYKISQAQVSRIIKKGNEHLKEYLL